MFQKNFVKLREHIIKIKSISSLIQLEYNAFTEIAMVPIGTFILSNSKNMNKYNGIYIKLSDFKGNMDVQKEKVINAIQKNTNYKFISNTKKFLKIPGYPIAYWAKDNIITSFENGTSLNEISDIKQGLSTTDNKRFLRRWFEIDYNKLGVSFNNRKDAKISNKKWFPYNKGGNYRKWYGNQEFVVNWKNDGEEIKNVVKEKYKNRSYAKDFDEKRWEKLIEVWVVKNSQYYFKTSLSWSEVSSSNISFRFFPNGFIFDSTGSSLFPNDINEFYLLGYLNSSINQYIVNLVSPNLHYTVGAISIIPIIFNTKLNEKIIKLVKENIRLCKNDWDEYEISWNFKIHPLLKFNEKLIKTGFNQWKNNRLQKINQLKTNEEELNLLFNSIYSTDIEYSVNESQLSIKKINENEIKTFISYAIGCMLGRYSLDKKGLQFTGGNFNINNYQKFKPDDDNIIPVLDTAYFDDDIVGYFTKFVETCFGKETLEENLDFIAGALSKSNKPSREIIRQYLLKNFFNDHKKTYKKCPIYWQFSSGKQNGFNCLVYMHRYEPSLVARIRTDYLHKTQKAIEQRIENNNNIINNSTSKQEIAKATKEKTKLQKQLKETQEYDEVLAHIANQNIEIDLDDGVKVNYAKFQNIEIKKEGSKTKKVNLLKKI